MSNENMFDHSVMEYINNRLHFFNGAFNDNLPRDPAYVKRLILSELNGVKTLLVKRTSKTTTANDKVCNHPQDKRYQHYDMWQCSVCLRLFWGDKSKTPEKDIYGADTYVYI